MSNFSRSEMERYMIKRALTPLKQMVESGRVDGYSLLNMMKEQHGLFTDKNHTPEFKRFKENMGLIYAGEPEIEASYPMESGDMYTFAPASYSYSHMLFKMHSLLAQQKYNSPKQLKDIMSKALKGKKILEIGCGPGANLKVLQNLGAKVVGVDNHPSLVGRIPGLDVRLGDASYLEEVLDEEKFDIVCSKDVMCDAILRNGAPARTLNGMARHTVVGGLGIHQITYEQIPLQVYLFGFWLRNKEMGRDADDLENYILSLSEEERKKACCTNASCICDSDLERAGLTLEERSEENGDLTTVLRKR